MWTLIFICERDLFRSFKIIFLCIYKRIFTCLSKICFVESNTKTLKLNIENLLLIFRLFRVNSLKKIIMFSWKKNKKYIKYSLYYSHYNLALSTTVHLIESLEHFNTSHRFVTISFVLYTINQYKRDTYSTLKPNFQRHRYTFSFRIIIIYCVQLLYGQTIRLENTEQHV